MYELHGAHDLHRIIHRNIFVQPPPFGRGFLRVIPNESDDLKSDNYAELSIEVRSLLSPPLPSQPPPSQPPPTPNVLSLHPTKEYRFVSFFISLLV